MFSLKFKITFVEAIREKKTHCHILQGLTEIKFAGVLLLTNKTVSQL